ncbi:Copia protein, partial [Durusdinium trenchii]
MEESRRLKLCYIGALLGLITLTIVRFKLFEDPHGAMLLMLVDILAILGLFLDSDYDMQCCKNCGIMAFIGGALDLSIAIETFGKAREVEFSWTNTPHVWMFFLAHLAYASAEIAWALLCYFVCQRIEETWETADEVYVATQ